MPEPIPYIAILRDALDPRERNVLLLARGGPLHAMRELSLKSEDDAAKLIGEVKRKAEAAVKRVRDLEAREAENEQARRARGTSRVGQREPVAAGVGANGHRPGVEVVPPMGLHEALEAASSDVPAEEAGMIHEEAAGADGSSVDDPPPSAPAADSSFDADDTEPPPLEREPDAATEVAEAEEQVREQDAGGYGPDPGASNEVAKPEHRPARGRGELREEFFMVLAERGPVRQADLVKIMDISQPTASILVRNNREMLDVGERVRGSCLLSLKPGAHLPAGASERDDEVDLPPLADNVERWYEYMDLLFRLAKEPDCPEHIFDRIERGLFDGPPSDVGDRT